MQSAFLIWPRLVALLFACLMLLACTEDAPDADATATTVHRNGLRVVAPVHYTVTKTAEGLRFQPNPDGRAANETVIEVHDAPPVASGDIQTKWTDNGKVAYTVQALGSGSGGTEYALTAWRPSGKRWIVMRARQQREWGPGFGEDWQMFESTTISKVK